MKAETKILNEIEYRRARLDESQVKIKNVKINLISECFPQGYWTYGIFHEIEFCLPFAFDLIETFKKFMADQLPDQKFKREARHVWDDSAQAGHFLYYQDFEVSFRTGRTGTTCVMNKIGEQTKVVPIFEVVCSDGAAE